MSRYALIRHDNIVDSVIVATPRFFEKVDPGWLAQFREWREVSDTDAAEPGSTFDPDTLRFVPPTRSVEDPDTALRAKVREVLVAEGVVLPASDAKTREGI